MGCVLGGLLLLLQLLLPHVLPVVRASASAFAADSVSVSVSVSVGVGWDEGSARCVSLDAINICATRGRRVAGSKNVDCLLLYRPRLVRDQTPNTRRPRKPGSQSRRTDPHYPSSQIHVACKHRVLYYAHWRSPVSVPVPVARQSQVSPAPVPRRACKTLLPKMDSDKTAGPCGLSGSSQCPTVLIRGLRSLPSPLHPVAPRRRSNWQTSCSMAPTRRCSASGSDAAICLSSFPPRSNPGEPSPAIPFCRSSEIGSVGPSLSHYNPLSGTGPPAEQIAAVLTPALPSCSLHPRPYPRP